MKAESIKPISLFQILVHVHNQRCHTAKGRIKEFTGELNFYLIYEKGRIRFLFVSIFCVPVQWRGDTMNKYEHVQPGKLLRWVFVLTIIFLAALMIVYEPHPAPLVVLILVVICLFLFPSLKVEITDSLIRVSFGPGLIKKQFPLSEITDARAVRNLWYYGWGIRKVPGGWMYNVSGLDAVEIRMVNGDLFRIGTDEPEKLLASIKQALPSRAP